MTGEELDRIMTQWGAVISHADDEWSRGFALNIKRCARRPSWRPSVKQAALMRQAVASLHEVGETVRIERS